MNNPSRGEFRRKLINRIVSLDTKSNFKNGVIVTETLTVALHKKAEATASLVESGTMKVVDFKDKICQRYATILDPNNWKECDGEAHSNPYIDNCMSCLPNWGKVWNKGD